MSVHLLLIKYQQNLLQGGRGGKACGGDSGSPLMVFDTTISPPSWIHIGIVHGGVVCSDFYKNLKFPEIFSRTEDSEVLDFIRDIMDSDDYYDDHFSSQESQVECDYYTLSYEEYGDCITVQNQCKTVNEIPCVFPFMFRRKERTKCISTPRRTQPWCPTQINNTTRLPVRDQWGYCNDECPKEGTEIRNFSEIELFMVKCISVLHSFLPVFFQLL